MAQFQGSRSAMLNGKNPVIIEKSKKKKNIENPDNPIHIHGDSVCLTYWTPNNNGGHSVNKVASNPYALTNLLTKLS